MKRIILSMGLASASLLSVSRGARAEEPPPSVTVRLRADDPRAVLERRPAELARRGDLAGVDGWQAVCVAPCTAAIPRGDRVRVGGSGIDPLELSADGPGPYDVTAHTGSAANETAGLALVLAGAAFLVVGCTGAVVAGRELSWGREADDPAAIGFTASLTGAILGSVLTGVGAALRFSAASGELVVTTDLDLGNGIHLTPAGLTF